MAARVIEVEAGVARAVIAENGDQAAIAQIGRTDDVHAVADAEAAHRGFCHEFGVVKDKRMWQGEILRNAVMFDFPTVEVLPARLAKAEAAVLQQFLRDLRGAVAGKVSRCGDDDAMQFAGQRHGDHIAREVFAEADARIKAVAHDVDGTVVGGDVETDIGVVSTEVVQAR